MGTTEDEMVGWYHQLDGYEFEQVPELAQTHVHQISDIIQLSHPL